MKFRVITVLLLALLLSGCNASAMGNRIDEAGDALKDRAAAAEDALEGALTTAPSQTTIQNAAITREQARTIALEHAGFTADQVTGLQVEYEIDDGIPRYEVQFRQGRWEYDYEIHAETGKIISYDRDEEY